MLHKIKIIIISLILLLIGSSIPFRGTHASPIGNAPNFEDHFAKPMTNPKIGDGQNQQRQEAAFAFAGISKDKPLKENIKLLFFPQKSGNGGGILRNVLRYVGYVLVFIFLVINGANLLLWAKNPDKLKEALNTFLVILIGAALYFGAVWLFGSVINLEGIRTTTGLRDNLTSKDSIIFFVLSFLKGAAFFYAIIMIVITGFQMMNPKSGEEWGGKKLLNNLTGIIAALVGMKVVDFLYYIASQENFAEAGGNFIVTVAKFLAYISGSVIVLMIIYSGYLLIVDGGKGENFKKAKTTLINILLAVISLFFFLFLIYQIFMEFN